MKKFRTIRFLLPLFAILLIATPVLAAYFAPYTIIEDTGVAYDMLGVTEDVNNQFLADNDFMEADALDTRIETLSGLEKPHMVATDRTLTAVPVPANPQTNLQFTTGNSDLPSMDIITGYDGFVTIPYAAALELGNDGEIEQSGYVDTDAGSGKYLVHKPGSFRTYVSGATDITTAIMGTDSINPVESMGGANIGLLNNHAVYLTAHDAAVAANFNANGTVGQAPGFNIYRGYIVFDTSAIPDNADIESAVLHLRGTNDTSVDDFDIVVRNGQPTYPSDPLVQADFNYTFYTGDGGSINSAVWNAAGDNAITLNATGESWISKTGTTKFAIISSEDIAASQPANNEFVIFSSANTTLTVNYYEESRVATASGIASGEQIIKTSITDTPDVTDYVAGASISLSMGSGIVPCVALETQELAAPAASVTFSGIDALVSAWDSAAGVTSRHLVVWVNAASEDAVAKRAVQIRLNSDAGTSYYYQALTGENAVADANMGTGNNYLFKYLGGTDYPFVVPGTTYANAFGGGTMLFPHAFNTTNDKAVVAMGGAVEDYVSAVVGRWASLNAITDMVLTLDTGDYATGSTFILGVVDERYLIEEQLLAGDGTIDFDSIPQDGHDLAVIGYVRGLRNSAVDILEQTINADVDPLNYNRQIMQGLAGVASAAQENNDRLTRIVGDRALNDPNDFSPALIFYSQYAEATNDSHYLVLGGVADLGATASYVVPASGRWNDVSAITRLRFYGGVVANFKAGTLFSLYRVPRYTIDRQELTGNAASITFAGIPQDYEALQLNIYARTDVGTPAENINISLNADGAAANYDTQLLSGEGAVVAAGRSAANRVWMQCAGAGAASANEFYGGIITLNQYAATTGHKHATILRGRVENAVHIVSARWENTDAITDIVLTPVTGPNFIAGSVFELVGVMPTRALVLEVDGDVEAVDALRGASAPDIPGTDWLIDMNNTMPYMDYYEHTVASTLIIDYDPIAMVVNTGLEGVAEAGSSDVLIVDTANLAGFADDYWNGARCIILSAGAAAPEGENSIVTDFDDASDTLTVSPAFTVAVANTDTYSIDFGTLIDEVAPVQNGRITWGVNPTGVAVTLGGMVSSSQPGIGETIEDETIDILPPTDTSDWYVEPDVTGALLTNPIRPFVTIMSDTTTISEMQAWVLLGLAFVLLVTVVAIRAVKGHLLIAGIASAGAVLLMVVLTIFPMWALVFVILFVIGGVIAERSPSL